VYIFVFFYITFSYCILAKGVATHLFGLRFCSKDCRSGL